MSQMVSFEVETVVDAENISEFANHYNEYMRSDFSENQIENVISAVISKFNRFSMLNKDHQAAEIQYRLDCLTFICNHEKTDPQKINWTPITGLLCDEFLHVFGRHDVKLMLIQHLITHFPTFDINRLDPYAGINILMASVKSQINDEHLVKGLLDAGADVHALSDGYGRPIHFISSQDDKYRLNKLYALLAYGADPSESISFLEYEYYDRKQNMKSFNSLSHLLETHLLHDELKMCSSFNKVRVALEHAPVAAARKSNTL